MLTEQLGLFDAPPPKPRPPTLEERFAQYVAENPHVYRVIVDLAREKVRAGATKVGMKALYEEARWLLKVRGKEDGVEYALNNSYTAPMARRIQELEPDLAGVFETRTRRAK